MQLYLAGSMPWKEKGIYDEIIINNKINMLQSFYYIDDWTIKMLPYFDNFLLDSGAFTFMSNTKKNIDWISYIKKYADFINKNKIKYSFELDIDSIVDYKEVIRYRFMLEDMINKKVIPVWHKSRGINEFYNMCDNYDYVAIGGIVTKEIKPKEYIYLNHFIKEAHKRESKIHGLGFTSLKNIQKYNFDSVDSTSWLSGNRFGNVYHFNGKAISNYSKKENQKMKDSKKVAIHNFNEWVKYSNYLMKGRQYEKSISFK